MNDPLRALPVVAACFLISCGDGSTPTATTTTTTVRPVMTDILLESSATLESNFFIAVLGRTQTSGQLEAIVDWTFPDSVVFVYLTEGDCSADQFTNLDCPGGPTCECEFLVTSEVAQPKPRVLTASNLSPTEFTLIVWNAGQQDESVSWQVLLRSGGTFLRTSGSSSTSEPSFERGMKAPPR